MGDLGTDSFFSTSAEASAVCAFNSKLPPTLFPHVIVHFWGGRHAIGSFLWKCSGEKRRMMTEEMQREKREGMRGDRFAFGQ